MSPKTIRLSFNKRRISGFTGNQLKMIAFILMLCDHIGYMLIENGVLYGQNPIYWNLALQTATGQHWYILAQVLRFLGRLSFPIFAFLTAEGYAHTKNAWKYILRLAFFAALSEVPFDLAVKGIVYYPDYQNVMITMLLGVVGLTLGERFGKKRIVLRWIIYALFCGAAYLAKSDYGAVGVLLIVTMYELRADKKLSTITGIIISAAESISYSGVAALAFGPIWLYNGKRGEMPMKYFFYAAYPIHLLLFWAMVYLSNR